MELTGECRRKQLACGFFAISVIFGVIFLCIFVLLFPSGTELKCCQLHGSDG